MMSWFAQSARKATPAKTRSAAAAEREKARPSSAAKPFVVENQFGEEDEHARLEKEVGDTHRVHFNLKGNEGLPKQYENDEENVCPENAEGLPSVGGAEKIITRSAAAATAKKAVLHNSTNANNVIPKTPSLDKGITPHRTLALEKIHANRARGAALKAKEMATMPSPTSEPSPSASVSPAASRRSESFASIDEFDAESDTDRTLISETRRSASGSEVHSPLTANKHPWFGKHLYDMKNGQQEVYKRVYVASSRELFKHVRRWYAQRRVDETRVQQIVNAKRNDPSFLGTISIFQFAEDVSRTPDEIQACAIIDGQHRSHAIAKLLKEMPEDQDIEILIEVYNVRSEIEVKNLFVEINKGESVQDIDLPKHLESAFKRNVDEVCERLQKEFPDMFKGERCRAPNLHRDRLRNDLFHSNRLEASEQSASANALYDAIITCNSMLSKRPEEKWPESVHRNLPKAKKHGLYLGLQKDWIEKVLEEQVLTFLEDGVADESLHTP
ncbi:Hypothetical Protein FCC1311_076402 [Hondaea fermentalgiana]|uniref:DGQHR domain-containing protein n=1 Tax=Hondaea fermentalgiana TaxID=2315210 RepID=A0A2R5GKI0_9STRA|nr:Hypothetical Protein FCC1311_076402 [Hondaea fermentalgiana]|eukprot:GBG31416.1 Hypothetical Protein FCC1311_076402 [Hondaea fermentalgiana]